MRNNKRAGNDWEREIIKEHLWGLDNYYGFIYNKSGEDHDNDIGRSGDRAPALDRAGIDIWIGRDGKFPAIQAKKQEGSPNTIDISAWHKIRTNDKYTWKVLLIKKMTKVKVKAKLVAKLAVIPIEKFSLLMKLMYLVPLIIKELDKDSDVRRELTNLVDELF